MHALAARKTLPRLLIRGNVHCLDKDLLGEALQLSSAQPYRTVQNSRKRDLGSYLRTATIYDTSGYISDDKRPELRPRTSCHERAASVGRSPITAVIKEVSKNSRRGQRAGGRGGGYNDVLQHIIDGTIRWEDEGRGLKPRSIMPSTSGENVRKDIGVPYCARLDLPRSHLSY